MYYPTSILASPSSISSPPPNPPLQTTQWPPPESPSQDTAPRSCRNNPSSSPLRSTGSILPGRTPHWHPTCRCRCSLSASCRRGSDRPQEILWMKSGYQTFVISRKRMRLYPLLLSKDCSSAGSVLLTGTNIAATNHLYSWSIFSKASTKE